MPGLTSDAQIIAYSEGCPRQIIAYSNLVYGFQCNMELTPEVLRSHDYQEMNQKLFVFLNKLSQVYLASQ